MASGINKNLMSINSKPPLIFLTGCINPKGMKHTRLQNPDIRRTHYLEAIRFYLNNTSCPILFVENSGSDIVEHFQKEIQNNRLEILTFDGNNYNSDLGKGYGEMLIIEHALNQSSFILNCDYVFKITGRYKILNINSFVKYYRYELNKQSLLVDLKQNSTFSDSRFFGSDVSFLSDVLLQYKNLVNDSRSIFFEHVLCKSTLEALTKNHHLAAFKSKPRYSGVYGTDNTVYNDSFWYWFPRNLKYWLRYSLK